MAAAEPTDGAPLSPPLELTFRGYLVMNTLSPSMLSAWKESSSTSCQPLARCRFQQQCAIGGISTKAVPSM